MIYFDYMATTPVDPRVAKVMNECLELTGCFANPASHSHSLGFAAADKVDCARTQVAQLIHADPREVIWTSGATESDNLALIGAARFYQRKGKHIITMKTEHKAVLDTCAFLESQGFEVSYLAPHSDGTLDLAELINAIRGDTLLVSIMHVNNETGVVQDIASIGKITRERGVLLHVDAAQGAGKLPIDVNAWSADLVSLSAHKCYGPKGIGALYVRRQPRVRLQPQIHGGGHQDGLRSGTLPTHQIVGMGEAFRLAKQEMAEDSRRIRSLYNTVWAELATVPGITLNGHPEQRSFNCLNVHIAGVDSESLMLSLPEIAISSGSACTSANPRPSHVLTAMGMSLVNAHSSVRISLGRYTTEQEVSQLIEQLVAAVTQLRQSSACWPV